MEYTTCSEFAEKSGLSVRRIQQMCRSGEIPGAQKQGHSWRIPADTVLAAGAKGSEPERKLLPVGISSFPSGYYKLLLRGQDTSDPGFYRQQADGFTVHPPPPFRQDAEHGYVACFL